MSVINVKKPVILTRIHTIPPEILLHIFKFVGPQGFRASGRRYLDLINLTHSTSYWRALAVTTPSLWTLIDITDHPSSLDIAKACLLRAAALKLNVSVRMATQIRSRLQRIIYFLEGVSDRTTTLQVNLILPEPMLSHYARASFGLIKFPVLQEMELDFRTNWNGRHDPRWEVCGFNLPEDAPNLRSVSMVDLAPALGSTAISRLTRLVLDAPSFDSVTWPAEQFWGVLEQATALEYLELQSWSPYDTYTRARDSPSSPPSFQYPRTTIPNLRQLVLRGFESPDLIYILLILNAPYLSQVVLELPGFSKRFNSGWDEVQVAHPFTSVSSLDLRLPYRTLPAFHEQFPAFLTRLFPNIGDLSMPLVGSLSILRQLVRSWDRPANSPQEVSRWSKLCRLSIVAEEEKCDRYCWERLDVVRRFILTRSKLLLPPLEWVALTLCDSVKKDKTFSQVVQYMRKILASENTLTLRYTVVSSSSCERYAAGRI